VYGWFFQTKLCNEPPRYDNYSSIQVQIFFFFVCYGVCACVEVTSCLTLQGHSTNDKTQHWVQHKNAERLNENYHNTTLGRGAQRRHLTKVKLTTTYD
jgi:hypothetical protein